MKNTFTRWISGALFVILGVLIAIGPQTIFKPCQSLLQTCVDGTPSGNYVPMKCHWSARAEIGAGAAVAFLGLLLLCFSQSQVRLGLSLAQTALGIVAVLFPAKIIGVCAGRTMLCHMFMLPMLLVLGGLVIAVSLVNTLLLFRRPE